MKILLSNTLSWFLKVLMNLLLFIYPSIPLSILFSHFSGHFPVPYRLCVVHFSNALKFRFSQFLKCRKRIINFLIKTYSKNFGSICLFLNFLTATFCHILHVLKHANYAFRKIFNGGRCKSRRFFIMDSESQKC